MSQAVDHDQRNLRRAVYLLLVTLSAGSMLGRIAAVNSVDRIALERALYRQGRKDWRQQRPFLSANDRSRWLTIRALVEHGTYAIDEVTRQPGWDTIDMVKHADRHGVAHLYSSKPPLLPTLLAGEYWLIYKLSGATLATHPYAVGRVMLVTVNLLPMLLFFAVVARWCERYGQTDWGRLFVMACATFATFLTTFAVVLNNHLIAAVSAAVGMDAALRVWYEGERRLRFFFIAGLFAAFAAENELPALSLLAFLTAGLLVRFPRSTLAAFAPGAAIVAVAFFGTNYAAHQSLRPPYLHRRPGDNWYDYTYERNGRTIESYWNHPVGVDRGEPSRGVYALNVLVGHHGIFSLTPVWGLSLWGAGIWIFARKRRRRGLAAMTVLLSVICLGFYLLRPLETRNYGGMTSGFRWMFWFAPLWLMVMLPAADWLAAARWRRALALVLLLMSTLSVAYPTWNPWTHPWIYDAIHGGPGSSAAP